MSRINRKKLYLRYVKYCEYVKETGQYPTFREIGKVWGITSTSHVSHILDQMVEAGFLEKTDAGSRGHKLVEVEILLPNQYYQIVNILISDGVLEETYEFPAQQEIAS